MDFEAWMHSPVVLAAHMKTGFVLAGGVFNAALAVFHLTFWRLFDWRRELRNLTFVNRGIVQTLNLCLAFVLVIFAYLSLAHAGEMTSSLMGYSLLAGIALFWLARAVLQVVFFRLRRWCSRVFFLVFLFGAFLYAVPAAVGLWPVLSSS